MCEGSCLRSVNQNLVKQIFRRGQFMSQTKILKFCLNEIDLTYESKFQIVKINFKEQFESIMFDN